MRFCILPAPTQPALTVAAAHARSPRLSPPRTPILLPLLLALTPFMLDEHLIAETPAVVESGVYSTDAAAQAEWKPMAGTAPVSIRLVAGQTALHLPVHFKGTSVERASWDRSVALDLNGCHAVQFQFYCSNARAVSYFSLYFQSGSGWYMSPFFPSKDGWNTIQLRLSTFNIEGTPAGWDAIRTIRLSAWRAQDVDTECGFRDLRTVGVLGQDTQIALVRCDSIASRDPRESRSVATYLGHVEKNFAAFGLNTATLSDANLNADTLRRAQLVVLPHNPSMPEPTLHALQEYLDHGGRLLAFYGIPEALQSHVGIKVGALRRASFDGEFAAMRFATNLVSNVPPVVQQRSWNILSLEPVPGRSFIAAEWLDQQGRSTGLPAVAISTNAAVVAHVLLDDDPEHKPAMLMALAGRLAPGLWENACQRSESELGRIGTYLHFAEATREIARLGAGRPRVRALLREAEQQRQAAQRQRSRREYASALHATQLAREKLLAAFAAAQRSVPNEFRGLWCHSAFGVSGLNWDSAIARLVQHGFNTIVPNMLWGGVAYYSSQVLPVAPEVSTRGDQIAACLAACRRHGAKMHVWKVNWNLGAAPSSFLESLRQEHRLQQDRSGKEEPWLCPSHPANRDLEIASMVEVARDYQVDGIHFDYIRYPDGNHCFCPGCRERFETHLGRPVPHWPDDLFTPGPLRTSWLDWRRANITAVVRAVSMQARPLHPGLKISAAVFRNWPHDRDDVGQDWKLWCDEHYLDFVCPMDYMDNDTQFDHTVEQQLPWAGKTPCYPGIGAWILSPDRVIGQIQITRRHATGGFMLFNYDPDLLRNTLPLLGAGITAVKP